MGARRGGVSGSNRRIPYEGVYVARFGGVMDEPTGVGVSNGGRIPLNPAPGVKPFHRGQHPCVELEGSSSKASMTWSRLPDWSAWAKRGRTASDRSRNGPSVRGVLSASQEPASIRVPSGSSERIADTRLLLPMPASPWSSTTEPVPRTASRAASTRVVSSRSRSSSGRVALRCYLADVG